MGYNSCESSLFIHYNDSLPKIHKKKNSDFQKS